MDSKLFETTAYDFGSYVGARRRSRGMNYGILLRTVLKEKPELGAEVISSLFSDVFYKNLRKSKVFEDLSYEMQAHNTWAGRAPTLNNFLGQLPNKWSEFIGSKPDLKDKLDIEFESSE